MASPFNLEPQDEQSFASEALFSFCSDHEFSPPPFNLPAAEIVSLSKRGIEVVKQRQEQCKESSWHPVDATGTVAPLLTEEAVSKFIRDARSMGLNRREAEKLADHIQEVLAKQKDSFAEPPIE